MRNGIFKYIFIIFVIVLTIITIIKVLDSDTEIQNETLDHTSKSNVIQTDLRLAIAEFDTLNPLLSNNKNVQEISKIIYEPLVTLDANLKLQYCLASEVAKTDDLNYIIKLKEGITWHDGSEFTAADVKFTIDTIKSGINSKYSDNLAAVSNLNIVDETTISITLDQRVPFFEYYLTFPIMCEQEFIEEDFVNSSKKDIALGTGLFSIESREGATIKLIRNEDYWNKEKTPMVEEIYINLYDAIGDVYEAFKNGDIDLVNVSTTDIDNYIGFLGYTKLEYKTRYYDFISFNTQSKIFSSSQVRKALSLVIDKSAMIAASLGNGFTPSNFSLDMGSWLYSNEVNIEPNLDLAKHILLTDGWEYKNNYWSKNIDGQFQKLEFSIIVNSNNGLRISAAENLVEQYGNFGIPVTITQVNPNKYVEILNNKSYDVMMAGLECGYSPNVETFFGENNLANYTNNEVNEILSEVSNTTDENKIKEKYKRLYEIYLEEAPYFGLFRETDYIIYNQGLVGSLKPNVFNVFQNIEKWYRQ